MLFDSAWVVVRSAGRDTVEQEADSGNDGGVARGVLSIAEAGQWRI